ncbi:hypothetical protein [Lysobacter gummosus]|uniref:hypothetical protein n=1 Tax=Lysobacter gummosus TaxID=262324 RepID=UPI00362C97C1
MAGGGLRGDGHGRSPEGRGSEVEAITHPRPRPVDYLPGNACRRRTWAIVAA